MKYSTIRLILLLSITLFIAHSCDDPLSKGGARGRVTPPPPIDAPREERASAVIDIKISDAIPQTPACGKVYTFTAEASEVAVACENYTFGLLYREALRHADERMAELQCLNGCRPNPYVIAEKGTCDQNKSEATVVLTMAFQCLHENTPPINGLPLRTDSNLQAPFEQSLPDVPQNSNEHLMISLIPNRLAERCPFDFKFWMTLEEKVNSCDAIANYGPFVAKAEEKAKKMWEVTSCGPNCTKAAFREIGAQWDCVGNAVKIQYVFQVPCKEN